MFEPGDSGQATKPEAETPSSRERKLLPADRVLGVGGGQTGGGKDTRPE